MIMLAVGAKCLSQGVIAPSHHMNHHNHHHHHVRSIADNAAFILRPRLQNYSLPYRAYMVDLPFQWSQSWIFQFRLHLAVLTVSTIRLAVCVNGGPLECCLHLIWKLLYRCLGGQLPHSTDSMYGLGPCGLQHEPFSFWHHSRPH